MIRVLIVDDSAFARKVIRECLERSPAIEVVGVARDGLEALEKIGTLAPDVITLDLIMPNLDGLGVLRAMPAGGPRAIVVSISDSESELGLEALAAGAVDVVHKPTALATEQLYELGAELVRKVLVAARARPLSAVPAPLMAAAAPRAASGREGPAGAVNGVVVIGTSTGGPQALTRLMLALPGDFSWPIAIALHIPAGYTDALAQRLDHGAALQVVEASEGMALAPGRAILARGGLHMTLVRGAAGAAVHLDHLPHDERYTPSVDLLFASAAKHFGSSVLGVVLTGMGDDGLRGAGAITRAGGRVLVEAESSCVVYGMPRSVQEAGLAVASAPIDAMAQAMLRNIS